MIHRTNQESGKTTEGRRELFGFSRLSFQPHSRNTENHPLWNAQARYDDYKGREGNNKVAPHSDRVIGGRDEKLKNIYGSRYAYEPYNRNRNLSWRDKVTYKRVEIEPSLNQQKRQANDAHAIVPYEKFDHNSSLLSVVGKDQKRGEYQEHMGNIRVSEWRV